MPTIHVSSLSVANLTPPTDQHFRSIVPRRTAPRRTAPAPQNATPTTTTSSVFGRPFGLTVPKPYHALRQAFEAGARVPAALEK
jgi:hypothetical protein